MDDGLLFPLCAMTIVTAFTLMFRFLERLAHEEEAAAVAPAGGVNRNIPSRSMVGVKNPFTVNLAGKNNANTSRKEGLVHLVLSSTVPCYVTLYWGVKVKTLESALRDQLGEDNMPQDDQESNSEEAKGSNAAPLEQILSGSYVDRGPSEFYESSPEIFVDSEVPTDFEEIIRLSRAGNHALVHPLVVVMEVSDKMKQDNFHPVDIVAVLGIFLVSPETNEFVMGMECVQTADGKLFSVKKLFLTQEEAERDTIPADEGIHPNSDMDADSSNFNNTVCIVCRSLPVTRALLPCRHACICGLCFGKINLCPMCRAGIQSFFRLQDEPFLPGDEPSVSAELGQLSSWELIRAIFSAD